MIIVLLYVYNAIKQSMYKQSTASIINLLNQSTSRIVNKLMSVNHQTFVMRTHTLSVEDIWNTSHYWDSIIYKHNVPTKSP